MTIYDMYQRLLAELDLEPLPLNTAPVTVTTVARPPSTRKNFNSGPDDMEDDSPLCQPVDEEIRRYFASGLHGDPRIPLLLRGWNCSQAQAVKDADHLAAKLESSAFAVLRYSTGDSLDDLLDAIIELGPNESARATSAGEFRSSDDEGDDDDDEALSTVTGRFESRSQCSRSSRRTARSASGVSTRARRVAAEKAMSHIASRRRKASGATASGYSSSTVNLLHHPSLHSESDYCPEEDEEEVEIDASYDEESDEYDDEETDGSLIGDPDRGRTVELRARAPCGVETEADEEEWSGGTPSIKALTMAIQSLNCCERRVILVMDNADYVTRGEWLDLIEFLSALSKRNLRLGVVAIYATSIGLISAKLGVEGADVFTVRWRRGNIFGGPILDKGDPLPIYGPAGSGVNQYPEVMVNLFLNLRRSQTTATVNGLNLYLQWLKQEELFDLKASESEQNRCKCRRCSLGVFLLQLFLIEKSGLITLRVAKGTLAMANSKRRPGGGSIDMDVAKLLETLSIA